ncbi:MAG: hypothetical protein JKY19_12565 [Alcanivoracaceae bacterium]|nr:hypothetical protein [Alcanivoracaceae bacterium]
MRKIIVIILVLILSVILIWPSIKKDSHEYIYVNDGNKLLQEKSKPPEISALKNLNMLVNTVSRPIVIEINDDKTTVENLNIHLSSSNQAIVADSGLNIVPQESGAVLIVTPIATAIGVTNITLTVTDTAGDHSSAKFRVTVSKRKISAVALITNLINMNESSEPVSLNDLTVEIDFEGLNWYELVINNYLQTQVSE